VANMHRLSAEGSMPSQTSASTSDCTTSTMDYAAFVFGNVGDKQEMTDVDFATSVSSVSTASDPNASAFGDCHFVYSLDNVDSNIGVYSY
jgi:hypothetical protein